VDEILRDSASSRPMISGATLAGALRAYLQSYMQGHWAKEDRTHPQRAQKLFGDISEEGENDASVMSWLMVDDAVCVQEAALSARDGVAIDGTTRSARQGQKFDHDMLPEGTIFPLSFELQVPEAAEGDAMLESLAVALRGLQNGEIHFGFRKHRGSGECKAQAWKVLRFDMHNKKDVAGWILGDESGVREGEDIEALLLNGRKIALEDQRDEFHLRAWLEISDTFLIRDAGVDAADPDHVPLADSDGNPILSGWSLTGALRHRAEKILNTLNLPYAEAMTDSMFGPYQKEKKKKAPRGSRLVVKETRIKNHGYDQNPLVQTRIQVDRFTGGAMRQHLFSEIPLTKGELEVDLALRNPCEGEIGLLLLLLKDLWTEDLPIGGESSIGRGRLKGLRAELAWKDERWVMAEDAGKFKLETGEPERLEKFTAAVRDWKEERDGR